jgi:hypothetical protein
MAASDAPPGLEGTLRVVDAAVDHTAIASARMLPQGLLFFKEKHLFSLRCQTIGNVTSHNSSTDDGHFHRRFLFRNEFNGNLYHNLPRDLNEF